VLGAPVQDPLCENGTHARQRVQRGCISRVEVDKTAAGARARRPLTRGTNPGSRGRRQPSRQDALPWFGHHDLLTVGDQTGQVEVVQVSRWSRAARSLDRIEDSRTRRQADDARATHLSHDMDQQHAGRGRQACSSRGGERHGDRP